MKRMTITPIDIDTLLAFRSNETTTKELVERLKLTRKQVWVRLRRLEYKGLVEKGGKRGVWRLTTEGKSLFKILGGKEKDQFDRTVELIDKVLTDLEEEEAVKYKLIKIRFALKFLLECMNLILLVMLLRIAWFDKDRDIYYTIEKTLEEYIIPTIRRIQILLSVRHELLFELLIDCIHEILSRITRYYTDYFCISEVIGETRNDLHRENHS